MSDGNQQMRTPTSQSGQYKTSSHEERLRVFRDSNEKSLKRKPVPPPAAGQPSTPPNEAQPTREGSVISSLDSEEMAIDLGNESPAVSPISKPEGRPAQPQYQQGYAYNPQVQHRQQSSQYGQGQNYHLRQQHADNTYAQTQYPGGQHAVNPYAQDPTHPLPPRQRTDTRHDLEAARAPYGGPYPEQSAQPGTPKKAVKKSKSSLKLFAEQFKPRGRK
ncbi:hypothetical protein FQN55_006106 [Onygenales sp. PD_40]|nr:hypothetical protein FQN55_006106 [Onygenales sp. PD_40]